MNSTLTHTSTPLSNFLEQKRLAQLEFPLASALELIRRCQPLRYGYRSDAIRALMKWLSPISRSKKQSIFVPTYLNSLEIAIIAEALSEEPSKIWQELVELELSNPRRPAKAINAFTLYDIDKRSY